MCPLQSSDSEWSLDVQITVCQPHLFKCLSAVQKQKVDTVSDGKQDTNFEAHEVHLPVSTSVSTDLDLWPLVNLELSFMVATFQYTIRDKSS